MRVLETLVRQIAPAEGPGGGPGDGRVDGAPAAPLVDAASAPVAEDDAYQTDEDTPLVANAEAGVLDNDFDGNAPGDAVLVTGPSTGTLELNPDGPFTYTPEGGFTGEDSCTYVLRTALFDAASTHTPPQHPVGHVPTSPPPPPQPRC